MTAASLLTLLAGCGEKKKSQDIITQRVETVKPQKPERMQEYHDSRDVAWIGRKYRVEVQRQPADSLPLVKDETGQKFVDNAITVAVRRSDGSTFYQHRFTKGDFESYLDDDYRKTGILEGLVFDKADGDWLTFAASVCHPHTDEYIPLVVRLSRMGEVVIRLDSLMDTMSDTLPTEPSSEDIRSAPSWSSMASGSGPVLTAMVMQRAATAARTPSGAFSTTTDCQGSTPHFFIPMRYGSGCGLP